MNASEEKQDLPGTPPVPVTKRAYAKPEVIELGDVRALTLGGTIGTKSDFGGMKRV